MTAGEAGRKREKTMDKQTAEEAGYFSDMTYTESGRPLGLLAELCWAWGVYPMQDPAGTHPHYPCGCHVRKSISSSNILHFQDVLYPCSAHRAGVAGALLPATDFSGLIWDSPA